MTEKTYETPCGTIRYWTNERDASPASLIFLPGLTADHRLFDKQTAYFEGKVRVLVWDPPAHGRSRPFAFSFTLADKARWLHGILLREGIGRPVIVGQSMGGYVGQMYSQLYPEHLAGFVAIDSAPLQREYVTGAELRLLKRMEPVYRHWPWRSLLKLGTEGVAESEYGRALMRGMMMEYDGDREHYAKLAGHGYRMLAEAMEADLPCELRCPALLLCGEKDRAGSCIRYNRAWHKKTGIPIVWIEGAGHNANTDAPERVNRLIEDFLAKLSAPG